jgi:hypothetical protein
LLNLLSLLNALMLFALLGRRKRGLGERFHFPALRFFCARRLHLGLFHFFFFSLLSSRLFYSSVFFWAYFIGLLCLFVCFLQKKKGHPFFSFSLGTEPKKKKRAMTGWVYAFATPSMPGIIKIGATKRAPAARLEEANASDTWRPPRAYVAVCVAQVDDPFASERAIHAMLAARRINARNEFFAMTAQEAQILLSLLVAAPSNDTEQFTTLTFAHHAPERLEIEDVDARPTRARASGPSGAAYEPALRDWIELNYTHIPLREKDTGTKLETLFGAYASANPPVHLRLLGRNKFAAMLNSIFPNIGPYRNTTNTVTSLYLLR